MAIVEDDNGKAFSVATGEEKEIHLFENPSTGYRWQAEVTDGITITGTRFVPATGRVGSGGSRHWTLRFTGPGQQEFRGLYKRPWEKTRNGAKVFLVSFKVSGRVD
jgi:inhibitor of cysteine peptidase